MSQDAAGIGHDAAGVEIDGLTVRYGDVTALDGLTFRLDGGKIYGLLGRNGSGKTTLLSTVAGLMRPAAGRLLVDGAEPFENAGVVERVCLVGHGGEVTDGDTVALALGRARRFRRGWDEEFASRLLDLFQVPAKRTTGKLSRGQRSALAIVIGLASRAPLTMLDEAYLGLDAPSRYAFYDVLLEDYIANPRTLIISTHLIEEVAKLFEEVVIIDRGRLVAHEETESLRVRGAAVTGPTKAVRAFTAGMTVLGERQLGPTASVTVYGDLGHERREQARAAGLELAPVALQDLFVHLTKGEPA